jgi:MFS family permease
MFLSVIALALVVGALAGGGLPRLAQLRLRWIWVLGVALGLRIGAALLAANGMDEGLPLGWLFIAAYLLIFIWLAGNWRVPGLQVAAIGIGLNTVALLLNGGQMPIWSVAFDAAGFTPGALANDPFHYLLPTGSPAEFVSRGGIFGDVVPLPVPILRDVLSIGDVLLAIGIFWAIVYSMIRPEAPMRASTLFGPRPGDPFPAAVVTGEVPAPMPPVAVIPEAEPVTRVRPQSAYLALVRNRSFSLLWVGQLVSFFGDRIHQVALGFLVISRGTPLDVGLVFAFTALPTVFLGPIAGALVDRWDRRSTMIACDLVRAALVLLVPWAFEIHIGLVYAIAFAVATVGLLFRPAKTAVVPAIVREEELVTANSASSVNETIADLVGYPVAAAIVATMGIGLIAAAFILDSMTYVVSALLIWGMTVPPEDLVRARFSVGAILREMGEGLRFLIRQTELLANTLVTAVAQLAFGAEVVGSLIYAERVLDQRLLPFPENYGWMMASLGLGSVIGGLFIGAFAAKAPKGPMTILGFVSMGLALIAIGLTRHPYVAVGLYFAVGVANMLFLVPTITLFQERTPQRLFGRVVSTRQALTLGAMAVSMGVAGWLSGLIGAATVLMLGGAMVAVAGLSGLLVPAMRDAR